MTSQEVRSAQTRTALLSAAEAAIARAGYAATSVDEICELAGVSKGAFYHHFSSKEEIFLMLLGGWLAGLEAQLENLGTASGDIPADLMSMMSLLGAILQVGGDRLPVYLEFWARAARDPYVLGEMLAPYRQYRDHFASLIETGIVSGALADAESQETARVIVAFAIGILVQGFMEPADADWERTARHGLRLLLAGLQPG